MHPQESVPILEALERMKRKHLVPFYVPGHKRGRGNPMLCDFLGDKTLEVDVNSMEMLDNLCHPVSVIKEAEALAAEAFHAAYAFFMVGGTTSAVQAMLLAELKPEDKIILPRNVHQSAINALILCGAIPVYIDPQVHPRPGIPLGMRVEDVQAAVSQHPEAKAVFINNPTYFGVCSNLQAIVKTAHEAGMKALVDEAHGTLFSFSDRLPMSAMEAGADMAAVSMHKSGGSLTQSSLLIVGKHVNPAYVQQVINLTQMTSASYLLMASLDASRRNLALCGRKMTDKVIKLSECARDEINDIGKYYAYSRELIDGDAVYNFDLTKLSIYTRSVGLAGVEVYNLLRDKYRIQTEFGDFSNLLAYVSVGDRQEDIENLVRALREIRHQPRAKHRDGREGKEQLKTDYIAPEVVASPQQAFYADKQPMAIDSQDILGKVCTESVICYPPGIPIFAPGERITDEILARLRHAKAIGCQVTGPEDIDVERLNVMKEPVCGC